MTNFNEKTTKLQELKQDYQLATGKTCNHFVCPILFVDEETEIIKGHVVNQAFPVEEGDTRGWTIQRKDVDSFYGTIEADYTLLQYTEDQLFEKTLLNKDFQFKPKLILNGEEIGYYVDKKNSTHIPSNFTTIRFEGEKSFDIVAKLPPHEVEKNSDSQWAFELYKDIQIPVIASLIKAAHLTLFTLFGYNYAYSTSGYFIGHDILGKFFDENKKYVNDRKLLIKNTSRFFSEYIHLVRPIAKIDFAIDFRGTLNDKHFLLCRDYDKQYWAIIVFIKTGQKLHSVMLPLMTTSDAVKEYLDFIKIDNKKEIIEVQVGRFINNKIEIDRTLFEIKWPKDHRY